MRKDILKINEEDNVAVACRNIAAGTVVNVGGKSIRLSQNVPAAHKIAICDIRKNETVIKYGCAIGRAACDIKAGDWVHVHNLVTVLNGLVKYTYEPNISPNICLIPQKKHFEGFVRKNGEVGTRNELWIIPLVSCVNSTVRIIAERAADLALGKCDGVYAFPHNAGCSQLGEDFLRTQKILSNLVHHPNAGGVLLVSLGCENNDMEHFLPVLGDMDPDRIKIMVCQDIEGDEIEYALARIREILKVMEEDKRETVFADRLKIGFKCGSSDGFSGITANPLCGCIADKITGLGGSAILTEVPEMFGAETLLMNRCIDQHCFEKVVDMINRFKHYYMDHKQPIYENPSPGNLRRGITTLEEKSLGCVQKGGTAVVVDVIDYGETCSTPGLNLMTGPGNDSVSITNLLSAGAQIILFTTGGGNPLGTAVPTVKISSNSETKWKKSGWIDFDAGNLLETGDFYHEAEKLWDTVLAIASGKKVKNEINGNREIMIFKDGVML